MTVGALANLGVLITRPKHQADQLADLIEARGGIALRYPTIEIVALDNLEAASPPEIAKLDVAVFVSGNAVTHGWPLLARDGGPDEHMIIAAVGHATARVLRDLGAVNVIHPSGVADSESLLRLSELQNIQGKRIGIFRGVGGRNLLRDVLIRRGARVDVIECYRRVKPILDMDALATALTRAQVAAITITSAEGLANLYSMLDPESAPVAKRVPHFVPHARIAEAALARGIERAIVTDSGDEALVKSIENYFSRQHALASSGAAS